MYWGQRAREPEARKGGEVTVVLEYGHYGEKT